MKRVKKSSAQAFLLLAQAHRKQGRFDEALKVMLRGVKRHPHWASAQILLGCVYVDLQLYKQALRHFKRAIELAPESLQAYKQLGDVFLRLKKTSKALAQYKKALLLAPQDKRAMQVVQKLESLTAADYDSELFDFEVSRPQAEPLGATSSGARPSGLTAAGPDGRLPVFKTLQRFVSLADAYIMRNDISQAIATINAGEQQLGPQPELNKRLRLLSKRQNRHLYSQHPELRPLSYQNLSEHYGPGAKQILLLKSLLRRVNTRSSIENRARARSASSSR